MENILTIGITTHGNRVSKEIISFLKGSNVSVIISEDKDIDSEFIPDYVNELSQSGTDTKYVFSKKSGIANNRQNILDNVKTKYFYTIDNDDVLKGNLTELTNFLSNNDYDIISIKCYEDGHYMHIPKDFFYMCTWMQIFKTDWFKGLGGYIQSWNFIHEECATNLNMKVNNGRKNYSKKIFQLLPII